ncbi:MAG TPA: CDP-alcohol phosphatidyltransferase family protein [Kofleriaceae bacterium]|jgi:phosphatidylglycerophosphate synthase
MWIAHALTLARIPLAIALFWVWDMPTVAALLVGAAALSDTLDGNVARALKRRGHTRPDIGGWLDPAADKAFVAIVLVVAYMHTHAWLTLAIIGARELVLLPLLAIALLVGKRSRIPDHADWLGKAATIAQFFALAALCAYPAAARPVACVAAALGLAAVAHYLVTAARRSTTGAP